MVRTNSYKHGGLDLVPLTIVIPLYKASAHIEALWNQLIPVLCALDEKKVELIFVDDGSPDDAVEKLLYLRDSLESAEDKEISDIPDIRIIRLARNAGQQAAVFCGLNHASGDKILTMDDDLQHPPSFIPEFLRQSGDYDLSYALPEKDLRSDNLKLGSRMRDLFFRGILGCPSNITPGSFRILSRRIVESVKESGGAFVYVSALIFRNNPSLKVQNVYYLNPENGDKQSEKAQQSRFTTSRRISLYLKLIYYYGLPFTGRLSKNPAYRIKEEI